MIWLPNARKPTLGYPCRGASIRRCPWLSRGSAAAPAPACAPAPRAAGSSPRSSRRSWRDARDDRPPPASSPDRGTPCPILRVGGAWRALPAGFLPWRTVYGWFRRWIDKGLFESLMRALAHRQRRRCGRRPTPRLAIIDTRSVK